MEGRNGCDMSMEKWKGKGRMVDDAWRKNYQKAKRAGICTRVGCGDKATHGTLCEFHREKVRRENRLRYRRKMGVYVEGGDDVLLKAGRNRIVNAEVKRK